MKRLKINKKYAARETMMVKKLTTNSIRHTMHNEKGKSWKKDKSWKKNRCDAIIIPKIRLKLQKPKLYRILLLNDDYTPMDFVVFVLKSFFKKNLEEATRIMLNVHQDGVGECGTYTYEVAEMKVVQVMECAHQNEHPLQCVME